MRSLRALALEALLVGVLVPAALAAPTKDGDVRVAGSCTGASTAKLKLSEENGRIEVEFEVDQNRGRPNVVGRLAPQRRRGCAPDEDHAHSERLVRVARGARNLAGTDRFVATGARPGETCTARARWTR